jgi:hypothetical protein
MFNKFKSKKEEARYEPVYKGTEDELTEEELDLYSREMFEMVKMGFDNPEEYREWKKSQEEKEEKEENVITR